MLCRTDCWHCALWHSQSSIMLSITVELFLYSSRKEPFVLAELTSLFLDTGAVILTSKVRLQGHLWSNADIPLFVTIISFIQNPLQFAITSWFWHRGRDSQLWWKWIIQDDLNAVSLPGTGEQWNVLTSDHSQLPYSLSPLAQIRPSSTLGCI